MDEEQLIAAQIGVKVLTERWFSLDEVKVLMRLAARDAFRRINGGKCWVAHSDFEGCASRSLETLLDLKPGQIKEYIIVEVI